MSKTLSAAKIEIARAAGAAGDANKLALAASAIAATAQRWTNKNNWEWCRKDNSVARTITGCSIADTTVTNIDTSGLNIGQTVTGSGIPANVTITAIPSVSALTVSTTGVTNAAIDLTFSAYIPILAGTAFYFLPADFSDFYTARLLTTKRYLEIIRDRQVDREQPTDQESNGPIVGITLAPPGSNAGFTAADQRPRCRVVPFKPDTAENLHLKYYRRIDGTADPIDVPTDFEFAFLEDAKTWFLAHLNSDDPRLTTIAALAKRDLNDAMSKDKGIEDEDVRLKSQMEVYQTNYTERGFPLRGH